MGTATSKKSESFLTANFLLENDTAAELYHEYAAIQPIIDYHSHLPPAEIAQDRKFDTMTSIWLDGDHYKWRAMRALGIEETYITGDAPDEAKFRKWAEAVPYTMRNPLYHWTHLELKNYFGIDQLLNADSAGEIYSHCNEMLKSPEFSTRNLMKGMNVKVACTTDDPADSLEYHQQIKEDGFEIQVLPTFRPDRAYSFDNPKAYNDYLNKLEEASGLTITGYSDLINALEKRVEYFHANGCRLSDHGLEQLYFEQAGAADIDAAFAKVREGRPLDPAQKRALTCAILLELGRLYHAKGWAQQFHLGALRNPNERMYNKLGPDTGFDAIGDFSQGRALAGFLSELDKTDQLAKTILYNLNPADNEVLATIAGSFNDGTIRGKVQYGSAWWYLDQKDGMEKQMNVLSNTGLLSCFIGMLTDSRSFLSYPRHEYFRRILCNLIGRDVEAGELPADIEWLGKIVSDICYHNANNYFNFQT